jgi:proteasome assembly chaperone (PAC2) family protein
MAAEEHLHDPWLVAAWPGMGGVAITAGYYLMSKLGMHLLLEFPAGDYFDIGQVDVKDGMILPRRLPRSRLFLWNDPERRRDLIVFIGEAQPPVRGGEFCRKVIEEARKLGVRRVFTFAAMATAMRPKDDCRVFGAAIDRGTLEEFRQLDVDILESGAISGLNGVLLGAAAAGGLPGGCLLGEMPHIFQQIPFPKASLAVLEFFGAMAGMEIDLDELRGHSAAVEKSLEDFLSRMKQAAREDRPEMPPEQARPGGAAATAGAADLRRIEELFSAARDDRSRAYELKQELDRLGMFLEFEDRFLDLFKDPGPSTDSEAS